MLSLPKMLPPRVGGKCHLLGVHSYVQPHVAMDVEAANSLSSRTLTRCQCSIT